MKIRNVQLDPWFCSGDVFSSKSYKTPGYYGIRIISDSACKFIIQNMLIE
jgi:hypothetical protein